MTRPTDHEAATAQIRAPEIWETFLDLCGWLAPAMPMRCPPRQATHWDSAVLLAREHRVEPAIWRAIDGIENAPNAIKAYFHFLHDRNARRNEAISAELEGVLAALNRQEITPILLKGAAGLVDNLYDDPAERYLTDVDILIPADRAKDSVAALEAIGWAFLHPNHWVMERSHQLPPLQAPSRRFCIELHTAVTSAKFDRMIRAQDAIRRAVPLIWRGQSASVLDPTDRILHNIIHSRLHDGRAASGTIELRQLRELCRLIVLDAQAIDWADIARRFRLAGHAAILAEQAVHCRVLMGVAMPGGDIDESRAMATLRAAVVDPPTHIHSPAAAARDLILAYAVGFVRHPGRLLNFLHPGWWPDRIAGIRNILRHGTRFPD